MLGEALWRRREWGVVVKHGAEGEEDRSMELFDLRVTVERIEGRSVCGMNVGDYFELVKSSQLRIPDGQHFCVFALQSALPFLAAKQRKLASADWLETDSLICCPDPDERLVMRIDRIGVRTMDAGELT
ncbi:putative repeat protein (TIGR04076 family) [Nakamurella sp. UYEF19]|uniref:TIGR04076 family protein n=1 Tax=Nakamurella sp. UYEF19 TaxID=1756392 RepID=UPI00339B203D